MTKENDFTLQELELIATHMPHYSKHRALMQKIRAKIIDMQPKTIRIGEFDVPEPLREAPRLCAILFTPNLVTTSGYLCITWDSDGTDDRMLQRGLLHTTKEAAIIHTKALLSLTETK